MGIADNEISEHQNVEREIMSELTFERSDKGIDFVKKRMLVLKDTK